MATVTFGLNEQKSSKNFKTSIVLHNVVNKGTKSAKNMAYSVPMYIGCVRFARYCGEMYSRHLKRTRKVLGQFFSLGVG